MRRSKILLQVCFLLLIPLGLAISLYLFLYRPPLSIGLGNREYSFNIYGDPESSESIDSSNQWENQNSLGFSYTLSDDQEYPSVSLTITDTAYGVMDFSDYDYVNIHIESQKSRFLVLQINVLLDGYSQLGKYETYLPLGYYVELNRPDNIYRIPLNQFKPYSWWLVHHQVSEERASRFNLDSAISIEVLSDPSFPTGVEDTIRFQNLSLEKDLPSVYRGIFICLFLYYAFFALLTLGRKRLKNIRQNREKIILIPYKSTILPEAEKEDQLVENFICSNYMNPLLNIAMVEDETAVSERNISKILKKKYNYSFPSFVNFLRITEAKKLLESGDMKILDIAMAVGYNSLGHFNRTFKKEENSTPREYRKEKQGLPV